jgi:hypothetical protein
MTRTISAALTTAIGLDVVAPGYLVEIAFGTPLRLSSRGTLSWSGSAWTAWDVRVQGLGISAGQSSGAGSLSIGNADYSVSALVLGEGIANRVVNVWAFYTESPATADPVHVFAGVADDAQIDPTRGVVTVSLVQTNARALFAPRLYITPESGFSHLPAPSTVIDWDGERYVLAEE